jgi:hypothetical protein
MALSHFELAAAVLAACEKWSKRHLKARGGGHAKYRNFISAGAQRAYAIVPL